MVSKAAELDLVASKASELVLVTCKAAALNLVACDVSRLDLVDCENSRIVISLKFIKNGWFNFIHNLIVEFVEYHNSFSSQLIEWFLFLYG